MQGLGYDHSVAEVTRRWTMVEDRKSNPALVALEDETAIGLIALHIAPMLFYPRPLARITTLVVAPERRRIGVGRALVEAAECLSAASPTCLGRPAWDPDLDGFQAFISSV